MPGCGGGTSTANQRRFSSSSSSSSITSSNSSSRNSPRGIASVVRLLLLRAGIERNPGPRNDWKVAGPGKKAPLTPTAAVQVAQGHAVVREGRTYKTPQAPVRRDEVCFRCGKLGHYAANCRAAADKLPSTREATRSTPTTAPATTAPATTPTAQPKKWLSKEVAPTMPCRLLLDPTTLTVEINERRALQILLQDQQREMAALQARFLERHFLIGMRVCPFGCGELVFALDVELHVARHLESARTRLTECIVIARGEAEHRLLQEFGTDELFSRRQTEWFAALDKIVAKEARKAAAQVTAAVKRDRKEDEEEAHQAPVSSGICAADSLCALLSSVGIPVALREIASRGKVRKNVPTSPVSALVALVAAGVVTAPFRVAPRMVGGNHIAFALRADVPSAWSALIVESDECAPVIVVTDALEQTSTTFHLVSCIGYSVLDECDEAHFVCLPAAQLGNEFAGVIGAYRAIGSAAAYDFGRVVRDEMIPVAAGDYATGCPRRRAKGCGRPMCECGRGFRNPGDAMCALCLSYEKPSVARTIKKRPIVDDDSTTSDATSNDGESVDVRTTVEAVATREESSGEDDPFQNLRGNIKETENEEDPSLRFATASVKAAVQGNVCPIARCGYAPNTRVGPALAQHANTTHTEEDRRLVAPKKLAASGLTRCETCGFLLPAPASARSQHVCGTFVPRSQQVRGQRAAFQQGAQPHPPQTHAVTQVFTDGSSGEHGSGASVWIAPGDQRNICFPVRDGIRPLDKRSNQRAELAAAVMATRRFNGLLDVNTDSQWVIDGFERRNATESHADLWDELELSRGRVKFSKVAAHQGILGNEAADITSRIASLTTTSSAARLELLQLYGAGGEQAADNDAKSCSDRPFVPRPAQRIAEIAPRATQQEPLQYHEDQDPWFYSRPGTHRQLHRHKWGGWAELCAKVLLGYSASPHADRMTRQLALLDLPRQHLVSIHPAKLNVKVEQSAWQETERSDGTATEQQLSATERRVVALLRLNAVGKAARRLDAAKMAPAPLTEEVIRQLAQLHPPEPPSDLRLPQCDRIFNVAPRVVHSAIKRKLGKGAAPGLDGWTRELLVPVAQRQDLLVELSAMIADMLSGDVSNIFAARVRAVPMIPLDKGVVPLKVRPVTPESLWAKLASHVGLAIIGTAPIDALQPLQMGVGGDVEVTANKIREDAKASEVLILLDGVNAYNALHRSRVLAEMYADPTWRPLWGLLGWLLGEPGFIGLYDSGTLVQQLRSTRGVRQGMVLGPLLFAVAVHRILSDAQTLFPEVRIHAYLDDIALCGKAARAEAAANHLAVKLGEVGIVINASKSKVTSTVPLLHPLRIAGVDLEDCSDQIVRVLGAAYAPRSQSTKQWLMAKMQKQQDFFAALTSGNLPLSARYSLLAVCGISRCNFLCRTHTFEELREATMWFDQQVQQLVESITGKMNRLGMVIARLPIRLGGLGLRMMTTAARFGKACCGVKNEQKRLLAEHDKAVHTALLLTLSGTEQCVSAASTAPMASRLLTDASLVIPDAAFKQYCQARCMMRVTPANTLCTCGAQATNDHVMCCSRLGGNPKIRRHDNILDALQYGLQSIGFECRREPQGVLHNNGRPDLLVATESGNAGTDVTVTHPVQYHTSRVAVLEAATAAAARKNAQWTAWATTTGTAFAPMVFETTGGMPACSRTWLRRVIGDRDTSLTISSTFDYIVGKMLVEMFKGQMALYASAMRKNVC